MPTARNLHSALNPAIKSLNYLNNILAKIEAINGGCEEAIMLNAEGFVAECTGDNIFIVKGGQLLDAAAVGRARLYGITRGVVMELARESGLTVSEPNLTRYDLFNADECFLTGTGAEIIAGGQDRRPGHRHGQAGPGHRAADSALSRLNQSVGRADI